VVKRRVEVTRRWAVLAAARRRTRNAGPHHRPASQGRL